MKGWAIFWAVWAVIAGLAFAAITAVVAVAGAADLRKMFEKLASKGRNEQ